MLWTIFLALLAHGDCVSPEHLRQEILKNIIAQRESITSLMVRYRCFVPDRQLLRESAVVRSLWYDTRGLVRLEVAHTNAVERSAIQAEDRQILICKPGELTRFWPNRLMYSVHILGERVLPAEIAQDPFFRATGLFVPNAYDSGCWDDIAYDIAVHLADEEYLLSRDPHDPSLVVLCLPKRDTIVLDGRCGWALVRRSTLSSDSAARMDVAVSSFRKVSDILWVPEHFSIRYTPPGGTVMETVGELLGVTIDEVPKEYREAFVAPAGAVEMDASGRLTQVVPGGLSYLQGHAEALRSRFYVRNLIGGGSLMYALIGSLLVATVIVGVRRGRSRPS